VIARWTMKTHFFVVAILLYCESSTDCWTLALL
jgi:hypothetical protein